MSGSLGGGTQKGNVKNKKTYAGDEAGRVPGVLDWLIGEFGRGGRSQGALSDLLTGGKNYGRAKDYYGYGPPGAGHQPTGGGAGHDFGQQGGQGGDAAPPAPGGTEGPQPGDDTPVNPGTNDETGHGGGGHGVWNQDAGNDTGDPNNPNPGPDFNQQKWAAENPNFDPEQWGGDLPTDDPSGLVGRYQGWMDNPWQKGPNGESETDVLGTYDWMSSGARTGDENDVYNRMGELGTQGTDAGNGRTLEGLSSDLNRDFMSGRQSDLEKSATGTYSDIAGGPNAQESQLYGETGAYGNTRGADQGTAADLYRNMVEHGGFDDATKAAMTKESMGAARSPFERARDRVLRGAAARGNPASTMGAEIALARDESNALGSTARQNQIAQAQEAIRQHEVGGQGLMGSQAMTNAQKQYALSERAGQNAQQAQQRLAGAGGVAGMGAAQRANQLAGSAANTALANEMAGRRAGALGMQAGENARQRGYQAAGAEGKGNMFEKMFGRKQAGAQGTQHIADTGQQERAGDFAGLANLGGKTREDYVESGGGDWSL